MRIGSNGGRWAAVGNLMTMGWVMGICVAIGLLAGMWLDSRLRTSPWMAVTGVVLGSIAAFRELIRMVSSSRRGKDE